MDLIMDIVMSIFYELNWLYTINFISGKANVKI